ncbi:phospholipase A1 [Drosophila albomicans]|uniref:Phospholipase A1 n=1 Tax=Drosophila albomicans TaxID=7291 RepID=A0A6P8W1Q7_DROAB|nr:phospholipase A1 [Drosophila albomicans]XP_034097572.1 phospholipase A1 [Drosophila albomicans]XP_051857905.1 phospholipase A1 [Drosophila albomicans]XP_051857907.1 phospholipase A1 [Drosophila albomicans]
MKMWFDILTIVLLLSTTQAQNDANPNVSYETEMKEFMSLFPDPNEPIDINFRSAFEEEESDDIVATLEADEYEGAERCEWNKCDNDLSEPSGIRSFFDLGFIKKIAHNLNPFANANHRMLFYLFRRSSPDCGRQLDFSNKRRWRRAGFNSSLPTRIIIHGWMSQSRGSFNRDVKNAYLKRGDFNVIVVDWSASSANINYFSVVKLIEEFGAQLVQFTRELNRRFGASYDDMYLIGHSLGAQIAGAAGKRLKPEQYNTIFALDPAGPKFRHRSAEFRIDPTDAKYVESMHTSGNFGFLRPTGAATFYPNYGLYQSKCFYLGCSHIRAYQMFAESINSPEGFWGTPCTRDNGDWQCDQSQRQAYQMGGEPSVQKAGIYYVKTSSSDPFALGRR